MKKKIKRPKTGKIDADISGNFLHWYPFSNLKATTKKNTIGISCRLADSKEARFVRTTPKAKNRIKDG